MPKQNARRNLQRTHRRRQKVERPAKIERQRITRYAFTAMLDDCMLDTRLYRHGARRLKAVDRMFTS